MDETKATTAPDGNRQEAAIVTPKEPLLLRDLPQEIQSKIFNLLDIRYQSSTLKDSKWALGGYLQEPLIKALEPWDSSLNVALRVLAERWTYQYYAGFEELPEYIISTIRYIHFDIGSDPTLKERYPRIAAKLRETYQMQTVSVYMTRFSFTLHSRNAELFAQFVKLLACFQHLQKVSLHLTMPRSNGLLVTAESMRKRIDNVVRVEAKKEELPGNHVSWGSIEEKWIWEAKLGKPMDWTKVTESVVG